MRRAYELKFANCRVETFANSWSLTKNLNLDYLCVGVIDSSVPATLESHEDIVSPR